MSGNNEGKRFVQVTMSSYDGTLSQTKAYSEDCSWVPVLQDFLRILSAEYGYNIQDSVRIKSKPWFDSEWAGETYNDNEADS
jgi:hypothetical protein